MSVHGYTDEEYEDNYDSDVDNVTLISKLDIGNPLHLHPNDFATLTVVSIKLKGTENYQVWSCAMLLALEGKNKTGFIDGSCRRSNTYEVLGRHEESHRVVSTSNVGTSQRSQSSVFNSSVNNRGATQRTPNSGNFSRPNNVTRPSGGGNRRTNGGPQLVCENCGFNGHTIDRCFKLIGYPADFGKRNNNNNNNSQGTQNFNRRFINNNSVGSSSSSTFSDDQLSKIISLIKDNSLNNGKGVQANMAAGVIVDSGANQHLTYTD
ncbi:ribonuclease H-like domain-containing protein [Tanacetum coccineum]